MSQTYQINAEIRIVAEDLKAAMETAFGSLIRLMVDNKGPGGILEYKITRGPDIDQKAWDEAYIEIDWDGLEIDG